MKAKLKSCIEMIWIKRETSFFSWAILAGRNMSNILFQVHTRERTVKTETRIGSYRHPIRAATARHGISSFEPHLANSAQCYLTLAGRRGHFEGGSIEPFSEKLSQIFYFTILGKCLICYWIDFCWKFVMSWESDLWLIYWSKVSIYRLSHLQ